VMCEKCSEIQCRLLLLLDLCTDVANIMRREVWSGRSCFVWRASWGLYWLDCIGYIVLVILYWLYCIIYIVLVIL
jgi:hypothetical protein